jgi:hypothetical protein
MPTILNLLSNFLMDICRHVDKLLQICDQAFGFISEKSKVWIFNLYIVTFGKWYLKFEVRVPESSFYKVFNKF